MVSSPPLRPLKLKLINVYRELYGRSQPGTPALPPFASFGLAGLAVRACLAVWVCSHLGPLSGLSGGPAWPWWLAEVVPGMSHRSICIWLYLANLDPRGGAAGGGGGELSAKLSAYVQMDGSGQILPQIYVRLIIPK